MAKRAIVLAFKPEPDVESVRDTYWSCDDCDTAVDIPCGLNANEIFALVQEHKKVCQPVRLSIAVNG